jgi:NADH-quinone oxidoreductase subunit G
VVAHAAFRTEAVEHHAHVVFPAESYAEKEGTLVHPDGRLQRLRPAIARPGQVRAEWQVLAELARRVGLDLSVHSGPMASAQLFGAVPFYAGLTLDEIGGRGVRWQEREAASALAAPAGEPARDDGKLAAVPIDAEALASYRSLWDAPEVRFSPTLQFLYPAEAP